MYTISFTLTYSRAFMVNFLYACSLFSFVAPFPVFFLLQSAMMAATPEFSDAVFLQKGDGRRVLVFVDWQIPGKGTNHFGNPTRDLARWDFVPNILNDHILQIVKIWERELYQVGHHQRIIKNVSKTVALIRGEDFKGHIMLSQFKWVILRQNVEFQFSGKTVYKNG